jgi:hypothetical protein
VLSKIGLNLDTDHAHGRVAFRQQQTDNSNSGTEVENPLAAAWGAEIGQQERIEAITIPPLRLREIQSAVVHGSLPAPEGTLKFNFLPVIVPSRRTARRLGCS